MTTTPGITEKDCCRTLRHEPGHALNCTGRKPMSLEAIAARLPEEMRDAFWAAAVDEHLDELERDAGLRCHVCGSDDTMAIVAPGKSVCADCLDLSDQP